MRVLYADESIAVLDKPSGLAVHRGYARDADTLHDRAIAELGAPVHLVHRLDRGTSGVLLVARDPASAKTLGEDIAAGTMAKRYLALVRGVPPESGRIDHAIPKDEGAERLPAVTAFIRLGASPVERCSLVEARPETGRYHQVRRHMKHISHPLVGDVNYGRGDINRLYREKYGFHRLALHALSLEFTHPRSSERMTVEAPLPPEFRALLDALGLP